MDAQLSFFLPQELKAEIERVAADAGMKISDVARLGMKLALPELRKRFGDLRRDDPPAEQKPLKRGKLAKV
jgi:hypothetical protein